VIAGPERSGRHPDAGARKAFRKKLNQDFCDVKESFTLEKPPPMAACSRKRSWKDRLFAGLDENAERATK
jgi:hypothetical protein